MAEPVRVRGVAWPGSSDRASIERFLAEVDAERKRLLAEIEAAGRRRAIAEKAALTHERALQSALGAIVVAAHQEILEVEQEHAVSIAALLASADAEVSALLAMARVEAARIQETARDVDRASSGPAPRAGLAHADAG